MQDPNARNCHGYRKFVKRSVLEDPSKGFLVNDTIVIKYTIELVVSSGEAEVRAPFGLKLLCCLLRCCQPHLACGRAGGALSRGNSSKADLVRLPPPCLGTDLHELLSTGNGADFTFVVEDEEMKVSHAREEGEA